MPDWRLDEVDGARISAVAPQKIFKKANQRNRVRRQIYEAIKPIYASIDSHVYAVVFAKSGVAEADFNVLEKDLNDIFVKAGILK